MNSKLCTVKFWHSENTADCSIGAWQIRLASVSLIPLGVGHVGFGCIGPDGGVTEGGGAVSLDVMIRFLSVILTLQHTTFFSGRRFSHVLLFLFFDYYCRTLFQGTLFTIRTGKCFTALFCALEASYVKTIKKAELNITDFCRKSF